MFLRLLTTWLILNFFANGAYLFYEKQLHNAALIEHKKITELNIKSNAGIKPFLSFYRFLNKLSDAVRDLTKKCLQG